MHNHIPIYAYAIHCTENKSKHVFCMCIYECFMDTCRSQFHYGFLADWSDSVAAGNHHFFQAPTLAPPWKTVASHIRHLGAMELLSQLWTLFLTKKSWETVLETGIATQVASDKIGNLQQPIAAWIVPSMLEPSRDPRLMTRINH